MILLQKEKYLKSLLTIRNWQQQVCILQFAALCADNDERT